VLRQRGIDTPEKLAKVPVTELGRWLGADAVVYGTVESYEAYYFGLIAGWRVGVGVRMVSTQDGSVLVEASGSRYDTNMMVALSIEDMLISSAENLLQMRDINLARAEEETCREVVHRIPVSTELEEREEQAALDYAEGGNPETAPGTPIALQSANPSQQPVLLKGSVAAATRTE
jgi:hypothetical protein